LSDLPKGLDATYDRILLSTNPEYRKQVANILKWLAFSLRPLIVEELAETFILNHDQNPPFDEGDRLHVPETVLNYLPSLVTKVNVMNRRRESSRDFEDVIEIRLAHFSIKEYLISPRIVQGPAGYFSTTETDAHLHISEACLAYHLHLSLTVLATKEESKRFALWEYVGKYWASHLERVPRGSWTSRASDGALKILTPSSQNLLNIIRTFDPDINRHPNWDLSLNDLATPLYYLACVDAVQLTEFLLEKGMDINELSPGDGGVALATAAWHGHINVVKLLLSRCANVHLQGGFFGNALQAAARYGSESIVQLLLDRDADVNAQGGHYGTALQAAAAAISGNESIVQLLLDRDADVNAQGGYFGSALQAAARCGSESIVQLLLDRDADVNTQGGFYGTALQAAAAISGNESIVQLLLDRDADINAKGIFGNALQAAIAGNELDAAELLVSRGATVDPPGPQFEELPREIAEVWGDSEVNRLRKFQEDPEGYFATRRMQLQ
jgi:ankyrin repeat protein